MRTRLCHLLIGVLAVGGPAAQAVENAAALATARASISADELRRHVEVLADDTFEGREAGSRGGRAAGHYLGREFQKHRLSGGAAPRSYYQPFSGQYQNILALLEGSHPRLKRELIVVGAHYDHVGYGNEQNSYGPTGYIHNGADDNASGVAVLLELAEAFSRLEPRPQRSILFALWDGEEKGLLGSEHWVAQPTWPLNQVRAALNLDMVGRLRGDQMEVYGARTGFGLRRLVSMNNAATNLRFDFSWTMREDSDHFSFYKRGVPVLMFHTGLHGDYHRPSDDLEKVNIAGMQRVAQMLFGVIGELANGPRLGGFRSASHGESSSTREMRERPIAPLAGRLGVTWQRRAKTDGLQVMSVAPGSAAARVRLRPGDRIMRFDGLELPDGDTLRDWVLAAKAPATLTIERPGMSQPLPLRVTFAGPPIRWGISWSSDPAEPGAVMVTRVVPGSPAARAGLRFRDRIYEVAGESFAGEPEFRRLLTAAETSPVDFLIERHGRVSSIEIEPLD
jgi:hypothetical protein